MRWEYGCTNRLALGVGGGVRSAACVARHFKYGCVHLLHGRGGFRHALRLQISAATGLFNLRGKLFGCGGEPVGNGVRVFGHLCNRITLLLDNILLMLDFCKVKHQRHGPHNIAVQIADKRSVNAEELVRSV